MTSFEICNNWLGYVIGDKKDFKKDYEHFGNRDKYKKQ